MKMGKNDERYAKFESSFTDEAVTYAKNVASLLAYGKSNSFRLSVAVLKLRAQPM